MNDYVEFENGEIILIKDFNKVFPMTMVRTNSLRVEVCEFIVDKYYQLLPNSLEWKILINLLSLRSNKVEIITALILMSRTKKIKVISTDFINKEFNHFFDYDIDIVSKSFKHSYIDKSQFMNAVIKFFINRLFRVLKKKRTSSNPSIVRAWTEHDIGLHKEKFYSSYIYIYPFGINLKRSFNFIKKCFKENNDVSLMGVPYSFNRLIKIFLNKNKDLSLLEYEIDAMKRHADDFCNFKTVYTSDEFLPAVPALYHELTKKNMSIINIAHGMGMLNPYNIYTKFKVVNELQKKFYEKFDQNIPFDVYREDTVKETFLDESLETCIVFIHQNLTTLDLYYEEELQQKIFLTLNNHSKKEIYIKFHPNIKLEEKNKILSTYENLKEIKNFDYTIHKYTFLATCSSAYYDFREIGPFIFIEDDLFKPTNYFSNIQTIHIDNLNSLINNKIK
jgi:hypothetical protein